MSTDPHVKAFFSKIADEIRREEEPARKAMLEPPASLPLAQRVTQGPYGQFQNSGPVKVGNLRGEQIAVVTDKIHDQREAVANGHLILEAFTVTHETGRTPRQLADDRAALASALRLARHFIVGAALAFPECREEAAALAEQFQKILIDHNQKP